MMRRILVPTDGSEAAMNGVRYAAVMARHHGATIRGLHVVDIRLLEGPVLNDLSAALGTAPYANCQGGISKLLEERGAAALEALTRVCQEEGVRCETVLDTGLVWRRILQNSELADLIVLGRSGEHAQWLDGLLGSTTEAVARRSTRPVLVTGRPVPGEGSFVIAYDGSAHAKRALQEAADLSVAWGVELDVLAIGESERAEALLTEARTYLDGHGVRVSYVARGGDPSEAIVFHAEQINAALIVMGAFGHSKVRELVVGSTTAYVLNHTPCPLLLVR